MKTIRALFDLFWSEPFNTRFCNFALGIGATIFFGSLIIQYVLR